MPVSANNISTAMDFPRCPLNVNIFAFKPSSRSDDSSKSYESMLQKKMFGFVILMIVLISTLPNDVSIGLTACPKQKDANKIGAKLELLFAKIPKIQSGSKLHFARFCAALMVLLRISSKVDCTPELSLI